MSDGGVHTAVGALSGRLHSSQMSNGLDIGFLQIQIVAAGASGLLRLDVIQARRIAGHNQPRLLRGNALECASLDVFP